MEEEEEAGRQGLQAAGDGAATLMERANGAAVAGAVTPRAPPLGTSPGGPPVASEERGAKLPPPSAHGQPSMLVFSGGTAFNGVVGELKKYTTRVAHVLPVSDDGGSTAEIVRVLGGPAIGDIRSRCLRLADGSTHEAKAVKRLLGHRLPMNNSEARVEWLDLVEGNHELWEGVSEPYQDTIRAFLVHFQHQILQHATEGFLFQNGSVGNFFFTGARTFFRSLDAAIFLFSRVAHIPTDSLVLPSIRTNDRLTLGAQLKNGLIIRGQHEISHPSVRDSPSRSSARNVNKGSPCPPLAAPIRRVLYMASEGSHLQDEVFPHVNPTVLDQLAEVDAIVYGMGSLYTSICPSLVLAGVGEAIARRKCPKILLLNSTHDRETADLTAADFVQAVTDALNRRGGSPLHALENPADAYVSTLIVPRGGEVPVDTQRLASLGVLHVVAVECVRGESGAVLYEAKALIAALERVMPGHMYVI